MAADFRVVADFRFASFHQVGGEKGGGGFRVRMPPNLVAPSPSHLCMGMIMTMNKML